MFVCKIFLFSFSLNLISCRFGSKHYPSKYQGPINFSSSREKITNINHRYILNSFPTPLRRILWKQNPHLQHRDSPHYFSLSRIFFFFLQIENSLNDHSSFTVTLKVIKRTFAWTNHFMNKQSPRELNSEDFFSFLST